MPDIYPHKVASYHLGGAVCRWRREMVWFEVINMETTRTIGSIIRSNPKTTAGLVVLW